MMQGAVIERGTVQSVSDGTAVVLSLTSFGVITPPIKCGDGISANDIVYYFMFPDGKGMVIAKA